MARKNLRGADDIKPDVLRQRRDLYALSIGLTLFQLAHGTLQDTNTIGGILPLKFGNPCWFLWAAWIGFFYFLIRYRLMSPPALSCWLDDARWQAGDGRRTRKIAANLVSRPTDIAGEPMQRERLLHSRGPVPMIRFSGFPPVLELRLEGLQTHVAFNHYGTESFNTSSERVLSTSEKAWLWLQFARGLFVSTWRERAFTDYVLPYLFAFLTMGIALWQYAVGQTRICIPWH